MKKDISDVLTKLTGIELGRLYLHDIADIYGGKDPGDDDYDNVVRSLDPLNRYQYFLFIALVKTFFSKGIQYNLAFAFVKIETLTWEIELSKVPEMQDQDEIDRHYAVLHGYTKLFFLLESVLDVFAGIMNIEYVKIDIDAFMKAYSEIFLMLDFDTLLPSQEQIESQLLGVRDVIRKLGL